MAIAVCAKCGRKVSTLAPACPACGTPALIVGSDRPTADSSTPTHPIAQSAGEVMLVGFGAIIFALAFCYPLLGHLSNSGFVHDWDFTGALHWVPYYSVSHFYQVPLWNPYKCGGVPMLGNPQSRILTPLFLLHLVFGPVVGLNLEIPLHIAIGWIGGYVLARILGLSWLAGLACGSTFVGSSWLYLRMAVGQVVFLPSAYLPWIAALMWLGIVRRRLFFAALAGLVLALAFGEGGVQTASLAGLLVAIVALALAAIRSSRWPLLALLVFGASFVGFGAIKLLPTYVLLEAHPRPVEFFEAHSLSRLATMLLSSRQDLYRPSFSGLAHFHEYGAYIGFIAGALAIAGGLSSYRRAFPWLIPGVVFFVLAMGEFSPYAPWTLLHQMPIFSQERIPSRFLIPFTLTVAVAAAFGVDFLRRHSRPFGDIPAALLVVAMIIDLWRVGPPNLRYALDGIESAFPSLAEFRQVGGDGSRIMLPLAKSNRGAIFCYDYFGYGYPTAVRGYNEPGYRGEQYLLGQGTVTVSEWTPNALSYDVDSPSPGVMVVNQNYDPSWRVVEGDGEVFSQDGLIGVWIGAGRQHLKLAYRSYPFLIGAAITLLSSISALLLWRFEVSSDRGWALRPAIARRLGLLRG